MRQTLGLLKCQKGQGALEYAIITLIVVLVFVALGLAVATGPLGTAITSVFTRIVTQVAAL